MRSPGAAQRHISGAEGQAYTSFGSPFSWNANVRDGRAKRPMDSAVKEMLKKQVVQEPIEIDTNFLAVGHVDEIISFVPAPGSPVNTALRFKVQQSEVSQ